MRRRAASAAKAATGLVALGILAACTTSSPAPEPPPNAAPAAAAAAAPSPPPIDLGGRWKLSAGASGCFMTLGAAPGAGQGTIAPEGGCPGNFYTSRKWTFEHQALIIRDHKGEPLAQLSYADGRFAGQDAGGAQLSLSR